jgi:hypothetical protein
LLGGALGVGLTSRVADVAARHHHHHGGGGGGGGGCIPQCDLAICGPDGCGGSCGTCGAGQTCQAGQCLNGGGGGGGGGGGAGNRCAGPTGICNADPTPCGHSANGDTCGCELSVENTTFCADGANPCPVKRECTSTAGDEATSCKNLPGAGLHFFCQAAKPCGCGLGTTTGKVCVAECDNPGGGGGGGGGGNALPLRTTCTPGTDTCAAGLQCDRPTDRHTCSSTVAGISDWCCIPPGGACSDECGCCGDFYCHFDNNNQGRCICNPEGGRCNGGGCATDNDCNGNTPDCCNGTCVDLLGDANHCGTCSTTCGAGKSCEAGNCQANAAAARHSRRGQRRTKTRRR